MVSDNIFKGVEIMSNDNFAIKICVSNAGILYIDKLYQCWVFPKGEKQFLPLILGEPITYYVKNGFGDLEGEKVCDLTSIMMHKLICHFDSTWPEDFEYRILKNPVAGYVYENSQKEWFDQVIFHPVLAKLPGIFHKGYSVGLITKLNYYDIPTLSLEYGDEDILNDADRVIPYTDEEIDTLKKGNLPEDWYLKPFENVLCFTQGEEYPHYIHFAKQYVQDDYFETFIITDQCDFTVLEEENNECSEAIPITDEQLDSFKCGI